MRWLSAGPLKAPGGVARTFGGGAASMQARGPEERNPEGISGPFGLPAPAPAPLRNIAHAVPKRRGFSREIPAAIIIRLAKGYGVRFGRRPVGGSASRTDRGDIGEAAWNYSTPPAPAHAAASTPSFFAAGKSPADKVATRRVAELTAVWRHESDEAGLRLVQTDGFAGGRSVQPGRRSSCARRPRARLAPIGNPDGGGNPVTFVVRRVSGAGPLGLYAACA